MDTITFNTALKELNIELQKLAEDIRHTEWDSRVAQRLQMKLKEIDRSFQVYGHKGYILDVSYDCTPIFKLKAKRKRIRTQLSIISVSIDDDIHMTKDMMLHMLAKFIKDEQKKRSDAFNAKKDTSKAGFTALLESYSMNVNDFFHIRKEFDRLPHVLRRELRAQQ